jgi:histidinol-phosphate aminotransferase
VAAPHTAPSAGSRAASRPWIAARKSITVGLLDYYRQFEGMSEEEVNQGLREQAAERRRKALTRVETLDLSQTTWPELPHPSIVNAITFVARRGLHRYPHHLRGSALRNELARRHDVDPARLILGNGAAELLSSATRALIEPGQQLITTWPSYPLYPIMARRAHGRAIPVSGGVDALLAAAQEPDTRVVALASPNDPTGELLSTAELERLLAGLPDHVAVLLDESLVEFSDAQPTNASLKLLKDHQRLLVFRSFSKAWGLAGLRVGYALGGPGAEDLLAELEPDLGVSEVSQAGALEALRSCSELLVRRVRAICEERARLTAALRERGFDVTDSQANFVWAAHPSVQGGELSARLARAGVLVAAGAALGEPRHVRIGVRDSAACDRLLGALETALV